MPIMGEMSSEDLLTRGMRILCQTVLNRMTETEKQSLKTRSRMPILRLCTALMACPTAVDIGVCKDLPLEESRMLVLVLARSLIHWMPTHASLKDRAAYDRAVCQLAEITLLECCLKHGLLTPEEIAALTQNT